MAPRFYEAGTGDADPGTAAEISAAALSQRTLGGASSVRVKSIVGFWEPTVNDERAGGLIQALVPTSPRRSI
jgi:hypothetical protein